VHEEQLEVILQQHLVQQVRREQLAKLENEVIVFSYCQLHGMQGLRVLHPRHHVRQLSRLLQIEILKLVCGHVILEYLPQRIIQRIHLLHKMEYRLCIQISYVHKKYDQVVLWEQAL
jgi:hypothetical protein